MAVRPGRRRCPGRDALPVDACRRGGRSWDGLRVMVTAGGTREPIDAVRFIGNRSSGRMGMALAAAAARRGAEVTLIAANVALPEPAGVKRIDVETTAELAYETRRTVRDPARAADGRRAGRLPHRADHRQDQAPGQPQPEPAADRGHPRRRSRPAAAESQTVVGFAAEHGGDAVGRARAKLARKGADLIVLNDVSDPTIGFESAENEVTLVAAADEVEVPKAGKDAVAEAILDRVERAPRRRTPEPPS